jgi:potassium-transporting ATPase KdpC subunit
MRAVLGYLRTASAGIRLLIVLSVPLGVVYPLAVTAIGQLPGLQSKADGSPVQAEGRVVGSGLLGQNFTDANGNPLRQYFQPRPSAAGDGYDPTATSASNLGPESIVDVLPNPSAKDDPGTPSLLTQVCSRSAEIGRLFGVDGRRPFCTSSGVGAVLAVFYAGPGYHGRITRVVSVNQAAPAAPFLATYRGVRVQLARFGVDYSRGRLVAVRGNAPRHPAVPPDAVTASGSGLDPDISPAYAALQERSVARARGITVGQVAAVVRAHESGRTLGFLGAPRVRVLELNLALDRQYPVNR